MASSTSRAEYADKTLAKNAMIDRKLKIRISNLDTAKNISQRHLTREEKAVRKELNTTRRMSCSNSPNPTIRSNRRASIPAKCMSEDVGEITRLGLPIDMPARRRSLPDMNAVVLPSIAQNKSLVGSRANEGEYLNERSIHRRYSEASHNLGTLSQRKMVQ